MSRSNRLGGVANATPHGLGHLAGGCSAPQIHLVQSLIFVLLLPDVLTNYALIAAHGGYEVPSRPEVLAHEIPLPLAVHPRQMNSTLAFDISNYLRYRVLGGNRNHHIHMIRSQMPFFNLTLLPLGQPSENFPKIPSQFLVKSFPAAFRDEHHMGVALPLCMV